ncbi:MAG: hypothetical protein KGI49_02090 [Patescibacteria group bacterium]|nr:hypothetical protein [Patescibacteria group bacterium]
MKKLLLLAMALMLLPVPSNAWVLISPPLGTTNQSQMQIMLLTNRVVALQRKTAQLSGTLDATAKHNEAVTYERNLLALVSLGMLAAIIFGFWGNWKAEGHKFQQKWLKPIGSKMTPKKITPIHRPQPAIAGGK